MVISFKEIKQQTEKLVNEYFDTLQETILSKLNTAVKNKQFNNITELSVDLSRNDENRTVLIYHIRDSESVVSMISCVLESIITNNIFEYDDLLDIENHIFDEFFGIKIEHENV